MVDASYPPPTPMAPPQAPPPGPMPAVMEAPPVGAAATAPGPPQMDFSRGDALLAGMGDPLARTNSMIQQNRAALAPLQAGAQQAGREYQQAAANVPPRPQQAAPDPQHGMGLEAAGEWVMIATGLGAIAGAMTRRSTTNALAAFTGAMEGVAAGNKQAFEQNRVIWEQENKRINQQLQQDRDAYLDILNSKKMNWDMKVLELQQEAARRRDDVMMQLAAQRNVTAIAERTDKMEELRVRGAGAFGKMDAQVQKFAQKDQQAKSIGDAIISGEQPPTTTGMYGMAPAVKAYLHSQGFDLNKAQLEWQSAQKEIQVLNGPQITKFRQLVGTLDSSIDRVNELAQQMQLKGVPLVNRLELEAYINAQGDTPNSRLATRYLTAVNNIKEEMAQASTGGYAPTMPAWELANQQINANYSVGKLHDSLDEVQRAIRIRLKASQTTGSGRENRYSPPPPPLETKATPPAAAEPPSGSKVIKYDAQGNPI